MMLLLVIFLLHASTDGIASEKVRLYFSFITALTGESTSNGGIPIIEYALEEINNNSDILANYSLHHTGIKDSKCSSISALESFLFHFDNESLAEPTYLSTICCGCSSATIPVAEISHHWNIPHISFASSSTALNDRSRFKSFFRTLPCYIYTPHTIASLMVEFEWTRLAVISQDSSTFRRVSAGLERIFDKREWLLKQIVFDSDEVSYATLFNEIGNNFRIILINSFEVHAYHIICEAFKMFGRRAFMNHEVVLILHARFSHEWWETAHLNLNSSCSREDVMTVLNYSLALTPDSYDIIDDPNITTISGINSEKFLEDYEDLMGNPQYKNFTKLDFIGSPYDAIWTLAVGLDMVDKWIQEGVPDNYCNDADLTGNFVRLEQFDYRNKKMGCLLNMAISSVNFTGITGRVTFRQEGARPENVMRIRQHRIEIVASSDYMVTRPTVARVMNKDTYVAGSAIYVEEGEFQFQKYESRKTLWPNLRETFSSPYDGSPQMVIDSIPVGITVVLYFFGCIGLIFAIAALVFNIIFRNRKVVKLGSPNLNFLIIAGSVILFLAVFFVGTSTSSFDNIAKETVMCNLRIWFFGIGYTLCFAVILAKQWRIYYIFSNPTPSKKIIKDWMLLIIIAILVAVDGIALTIGTALPQTRLTAEAVLDNDELQTTEDGFNQEVYILQCKQKASNVWIGFLFAYKGLLQLAAIFMAFTTRKVKIKALNDTKETSLMIYLNSIIITVLIVTEFGLNRHRNACIAVLGISFFIAAMLFLAVVFIPRVVLLIIDPEGNNILKSQTTPNSSVHAFDEVADLKTKNRMLQKEIKLLKQQSTVGNGTSSMQHQNGTANLEQNGTANLEQNGTANLEQNGTANLEQADDVLEKTDTIKFNV